MARPMIVIVSDDSSHQHQVRPVAGAMGAVMKAYTWTDWMRNLEDPVARAAMFGEGPALAVGQPQSETMGAKILQFPSSGSAANRKVHTINELESLAIQNAIDECGGNLTEAARMLGIGRATLYRKVKLYKIDPASARRTRRAA